MFCAFPLFRRSVTKGGRHIFLEVLRVAPWKGYSPSLYIALKGNDRITQCDSVYMVRHPRGSYIVTPLLPLELGTPQKQIHSSDAVIHTQESPPQERFLVGCSSPFMRLAQHTSWRVALGATNICLVGANPTSSVPAL